MWMGKKIENVQWMISQLLTGSNELQAISRYDALPA